jgi:hypothetical protein
LPTKCRQLLSTTGKRKRDKQNEQAVFMHVRLLGAVMISDEAREKHARGVLLDKTSF